MSASRGIVTVGSIELRRSGIPQRLNVRMGLGVGIGIRLRDGGGGDTPFNHGVGCLDTVTRCGSVESSSFSAECGFGCGWRGAGIINELRRGLANRILRTVG